jgi:hypothetical protein
MKEKVTSSTSGNVDTCYKPHACQYLTDTDIQSWKNTSLPSLTQIHDVHVLNCKETVSQLPLATNVTSLFYHTRNKTIIPRPPQTSHLPNPATLQFSVEYCAKLGLALQPT